LIIVILETETNPVLNLTKENPFLHCHLMVLVVLVDGGGVTLLLCLLNNKSNKSENNGVGGVKFV
jgi:hypothetical protein